MTREEKFNDYAGFVEKFKPKKTTDDCYTPPMVYEAVKDWACRRYETFSTPDTAAKIWELSARERDIIQTLNSQNDERPCAPPDRCDTGAFCVGSADFLQTF